MSNTKQIDKLTCLFTDKVNLISQHNELNKKVICFKNKDRYEGDQMHGA